MRCCLSDARAQFESVFKWFRKICQADAPDSAASQLPLSKDENLRITRALQTRTTALSTDWFLPFGVSAYFASADMPMSFAEHRLIVSAHLLPSSYAACGTGPSVRAGDGISEVGGAYPSGASVSVGSSSVASDPTPFPSQSLSQQLKALAVHWGSMRAKVALARACPLVACIPIERGDSALPVAVSLHVDPTPSWRLPMSSGGARVKASLSQVVSIAVQMETAVDVYILRIIGAPSGAADRSPTIYAGVFRPEGALRLCASSFYGHVRASGGDAGVVRGMRPSAASSTDPLIPLCVTL